MAAAQQQLITQLLRESASEGRTKSAAARQMGLGRNQYGRPYGGEAALFNLPLNFPLMELLTPDLSAHQPPADGSHLGGGSMIHNEDVLINPKGLQR